MRRNVEENERTLQGKRISNQRNGTLSLGLQGRCRCLPHHSSREPRKGAKIGRVLLSPADPNVALIPDDADLDHQPLALLEAEIARLEKLVSVTRHSEQVRSLIEAYYRGNTALIRMKDKLADCEGAKDRVKALVEEREAAYVRVFDAIVAEEGIITDLYSPLMTRLNAAGGTLKKLSFSVRREADVDHWAADGEELLDLRRQGSFKGRGTLQQLADTALKAAWETGDPQTVNTAMAQFRTEPGRTVGAIAYTQADQATIENGPSGSQNGSTALNTSISNTASTTTALTFVSYRRAHEASYCCFCTLHSTTPMIGPLSLTSPRKT